MNVLNGLFTPEPDKILRWCKHPNSSPEKASIENLVLDYSKKCVELEEETGGNVAEAATEN